MFAPPPSLNLSEENAQAYTKKENKVRVSEDLSQ